MTANNRGKTHIHNNNDNYYLNIYTDTLFTSLPQILVFIILHLVFYLFHFPNSMVGRVVQYEHFADTWYFLYFHVSVQSLSYFLCFST